MVCAASLCRGLLAGAESLGGGGRRSQPARSSRRLDSSPGRRVVSSGRQRVEHLPQGGQHAGIRRREVPADLQCLHETERPLQMHASRGSLGNLRLPRE